MDKSLWKSFVADVRLRNFRKERGRSRIVEYEVKPRASWPMNGRLSSGRLWK